MLSSEGTNGAVTVVSTWSRTRLTGLFSTALTRRLGSEVGVTWRVWVTTPAKHSAAPTTSDSQLMTPS